MPFLFKNITRWVPFRFSDVMGCTVQSAPLNSSVRLILGPCLRQLHATEFSCAISNPAAATSQSNSSSQAGPSGSVHLPIPPLPFPNVSPPTSCCLCAEPLGVAPRSRMPCGGNISQFAALSRPDSYMSEPLARMSSASLDDLKTRIEANQDALNEINMSAAFLKLAHLSALDDRCASSSETSTSASSKTVSAVSMSARTSSRHGYGTSSGTRFGTRSKSNRGGATGGLRTDQSGSTVTGVHQYSSSTETDLCSVKEVLFKLSLPMLDLFSAASLSSTVWALSESSAGAADLAFLEALAGCISARVSELNTYQTARLALAFRTLSLSHKSDQGLPPFLNSTYKNLTHHTVTLIQAGSVTDIPPLLRSLSQADLYEEGLVSAAVSVVSEKMTDVPVEDLVTFVTSLYRMRHQDPDFMAQLAAHVLPMEPCVFQPQEVGWLVLSFAELDCWLGLGLQLGALGRAVAENDDIGFSGQDALNLARAYGLMGQAEPWLDNLMGRLQVEGLLDPGKAVHYLQYAPLVWDPNQAAWGQSGRGGSESGSGDSSNGGGSQEGQGGLRPGLEVAKVQGFDSSTRRGDFDLETQTPPGLLLSCTLSVAPWVFEPSPLSSPASRPPSAPFLSSPAAHMSEDDAPLPAHGTGQQGPASLAPAVSQALLRALETAVGPVATRQGGTSSSELVTSPRAVVFVASLSSTSSTARRQLIGWPAAEWHALVKRNVLPVVVLLEEWYSLESSIARVAYMQRQLMVAEQKVREAGERVREATKKVKEAKEKLQAPPRSAPKGDGRGRENEEEEMLIAPYYSSMQQEGNPEHHRILTSAIASAQSIELLTQLVQKERHRLNDINLSAAFSRLSRLYIQGPGRVPAQVKVHVETPKLLSALLVQLSLPRLHTFPMASLSPVVWSCVMLQWGSTEFEIEFLRAVVHHMGGKLHELGAYDTANLAYGFGSLASQGDCQKHEFVQETFHMLLRNVVPKLRYNKPASLANMLKSMARARVYEPTFVAQVIGHASEQLDDFTLPDLCNMVWHLSNLRHVDPSFLSRLALRALVYDSSVYSPENAHHLVYGLAKLGCCQGLEAQLGEIGDSLSLRHRSGFDEMQITRLLWSHTVMRIYQPWMLRLAQQCWGEGMLEMNVAQPEASAARQDDEKRAEDENKLWNPTGRTSTRKRKLGTGREDANTRQKIHLGVEAKELSRRKSVE
eukprot:gene8844-83_t